MHVSSFMTACPYRISGAKSIDDALKMMQLRNIRHLPVVRDETAESTDAGEVVGVVTKRDVELSKMVCETTKYCPNLSDICAVEPFIVASDAEVAEVSREMAERKLDYALVADASGFLVGIFTTTDACRALSLILGELDVSGG